MLTVALLLAGVWLALVLARWLRVPSIPVLLVFGAILANARLLTGETMNDVLNLGATFILFVAGTELNPERVGKQKRAALRVGLLHFVLLGLAGYGAALLLGFGPITSLYISLALTASSTLVGLNLLQRRKQVFEPFGRLVLGVLLLQDLLVILLIPIVTQASRGLSAIAYGMLATLGMVALTFACLRWLSPLILRLRDDEETLLVAVLGLLFVFVGGADMLGIPLVAGAFLAGLALSRFPVSGVLRSQLGSITDFFSALFFLALGGFLVFPNLLEMAQALVLSALVIVLTLPLVIIIAERAGFSALPAIESGLLLAQTSELSLVVALQGVVLGHIGSDVFTVIALVTAFTMLLTPFLSSDTVARWLLRFHPLRAQALVTTRPRDHVLLLGCGSGGMPLLETLLAGGKHVVVVDDDPAIIARLSEGEIPCIRGDANDPDVLEAAGAARARIISSTIRRPRDNARLLATAKSVPVLVRVFDDHDADWVREMGGIPILASAAAAHSFMRWFETHYSRDPQELEPASPLGEMVS
jgi:CPA2 family monovalent cation:H+ antiporter-2